MIKCQACGQPKKDHTKDLWDMHKKMHEAYKKLRTR